MYIDIDIDIIYIYIYMYVCMHTNQYIRRDDKSKKCIHVYTCERLCACISV